MEYLIPGAAGLVATVCMSLFMTGITRLGLANADMVHAVGTLFTKKKENATIPGLLVHLFSGMGFAYFYAAAISIFPISALSSICVGAMLGGFHGLAVAFILVALVAENHPMQEFRDAGGQVSIAHFLGHVLYGIVIGAGIGLSGFDLLSRLR